MSLQNNIDFERLLAQITEEANKLQTSNRQDPAPPPDAIVAAAVAAGILRPPPPPVVAAPVATLSTAPFRPPPYRFLEKENYRMKMMYQKRRKWTEEKT